MQDVWEYDASACDITSERESSLLIGPPMYVLPGGASEPARPEPHDDELDVALLIIDVGLSGESAGGEFQPSIDAAVSKVSRRLRQQFRNHDLITRLGAARVAVLVEGVHSAGDLLVLKNRVSEALRNPFQIAGLQVQLSMSVDGELYSIAQSSFALSVKGSRVEFMRSGQHGRRAIRYWGGAWSSDNSGADQRALSAALQRKEFDLNFEPLVSLSTGSIYCVEARIHWRDPALSRLRAEQMTALLDEGGALVPLGDWLLREACRQLAEWHRRGYPDLGLAVHVTIRQLQDAELVRRIGRVLADTGIDGRHLNVELIEAALLDNSESISRALRQLKTMGVRISLVNFGTGHSSLSYLKQFPIDVIKIDGSFVHEITFDLEDAMIVKATIAMAKSLGIDVVAEAVQTRSQAAFLCSNGCRHIQGPYISAPLNPSGIYRLLESRNNWSLQEADLHGAQRTLLIVDDEQNILSSIKRALRREEYRILTATNALAAFELLATEPVGVVISDQRMEEMPGVEFFRRVRELYPNTVRIMLSGYTELQAVTRSINEGAIYKFLTKPWEDSQLIAHVADAFRRFEQDREYRRAAEVNSCSARLVAPGHPAALQKPWVCLPEKKDIL